MTPSREPDDDEDEWEDTVSIGANWDDEPTVPCPYCRREILEDSPRCSYCERYISEEDHAGPRKPLWIIATALFCLGIAIWWAISALRG